MHWTDDEDEEEEAGDCGDCGDGEGDEEGDDICEWPRELASIWNHMRSAPWQSIASQLPDTLRRVRRDFGQKKLCDLYFSGNPNLTWATRSGGLIVYMAHHLGEFGPELLELTRTCLSLLEHPLAERAQQGLNRVLEMFATCQRSQSLRTVLLESGACPLGPTGMGRGMNKTFHTAFTALHAAASEPVAFKHIVTWCKANNRTAAWTFDSLNEFGNYCSQHDELAYAVRMVLRTAFTNPKEAVMLAQAVYTDTRRFLSQEAQLLLGTYGAPDSFDTLASLLQNTRVSRDVEQRFSWDLRWRLKEGGPIATMTREFVRTAKSLNLHNVAEASALFLQPFTVDNRRFFPLECKKRAFTYLMCMARLRFPSDLSLHVMGYAIDRRDAWVM